MFRSPRNVALAPPASHRGHTKGQAIARMTTQVFATLVTIFVLASPGSLTAGERTVTKSQASPPASVDEQAPIQGEDCTELIFDDVVRTHCRYGTLPVDKGNPALRGICTTLYGVRTCY
jgi:hypothetical protein